MCRRWEMDVKLRDEFMRLWDKYFPGIELPLVFYYTDEAGWAKLAGKGADTQCLVSDLERVRAGKTLVLDVETTQCGGGKRYLGFSQKLRPDFEFFLSCGIPGKMEGERFKKSPELVRQYLANMPPFEAPGKYVVFKRWDKLEVDEVPLAVILFAAPDVLSGLFSLANFDLADVNGVVAPSGSGCATMVYYPLVEAKSEHPRAVLGMFDVAARSCMGPHVLTFSVPMARFTEMVRNMDESFLTGRPWQEIKSRIKG
jgi:uncharacterized protein (DUF169 family)